MSILAPAASCFSLIFVYIYIFLIFILYLSCFSVTKFSLININNNLLIMRFAIRVVFVAIFLLLDTSAIILCKLFLLSC